MVRLNRAQQQERTRRTVLAAARAEFAELGYGEAKVDRIAERAELTRGAVYSNFPSKRALYLAVLIDTVSASDDAVASPASIADALGAFARVWLQRLPLSGDTPGSGHLQLRSLAGVLDDEPARAVSAQLTQLDALLLALALEARGPRGGKRARRVRLAQLALTLLDGAGHLAATAPGFGDPFDVANACAHLAEIGIADRWDPPHLPFAVPAQIVQDGWNPPPDPTDLVTGRRIGLGVDGVVAVLGTHRLEAAEEAVRVARPGDRVAVAVVTGDPAETGRLVRLRISDLATCLRRVFAPADLPRLHVVLDDAGTVAAAAGVADAGSTTEAAVRIQDGAIVARAEGRGALHAAASAGRSARP